MYSRSMYLPRAVCGLVKVACWYMICNAIAELYQLIYELVNHSVFLYVW